MKERLFRALTDIRDDEQTGQRVAILDGDEASPVRLHDFHPIDAGRAIIGKIVTSRKGYGSRVVPEAVSVRLPSGHPYNLTTDFTPVPIRFKG